MSSSRLGLAISILAFCAGFAICQPGAEKGEPGSLVVKLDSDTMPEGARLRLGKLSGYRYTGQFNSAILSADAKLLAVVSANTGGVDIVDVASGKLVQRLKTQVFGSVAGMSFSPDGKLMAMETFGQDLRIWEVASGKQVQQMQHKNNGGGGRPGGPSFSRDGKVVCVGLERFVNKGNQGEIKAWEVATGKVIGPFETIHNYNIRATVAPDGKSMISWGHYSPRGPGMAADREIPRTIQVWDLDKAKEARQIKLDFGPQGYGNLIDVAFTPDGKTLAVTSGMSTFHLIDFETGKETRRFSGQRGNNFIRFSPDGQVMAAYDQYGGNVQAWDFNTGKRLELADGPKTNLLGLGFPGNKRVIAMGNLSQSLIWWEPTADEKTSPFQGHLTPIVGLAYTPDGKSLITAGTDQRLLWWDARTGALERDQRLLDDDASRYGGGGPIHAVTLSPNARFAATVSNAGNGGVRLWNLKNGKVLYDFEGPRSYSNPGIAFSPDSSKVAASGSQYPLHIWNLETGQELPKLPANKMQNVFDGGGGPARIAFAPNGKTVAVHLNHYDRFTGQPASDLLVWDMERARELHRLKIPTANFGGVGGSGNIAFSRDSRFFAVSDGAGSIILINAETGVEWRRLSTTLRNSAFHLAFSADGRFVAAGSVPRFLGGGITPLRSDDPLIEIWELAGALKRDQFKGHTAAITGLAFSPDATTLASTSMDATTILWDLTGQSGPKLSPLAENELPEAWKSLSGKDPAISIAMKRMAQAPERTVEFLKKQFVPVKGVVIEEKTIDALVNDLDSSVFQVRARATKELIRLGERAEPALHKGLAGNATVEARRRIQDILATIVRHEYSPGELQAIRGVEILERIGNAEAREWLTTLSQGDAVATATREARAALKRMAPQ